MLTSADILVLCKQLQDGLITEFELLLKLQLAPDVVDRIIQVKKLPYMAARKIQIEDLMHDDPRIEAQACFELKRSTLDADLQEYAREIACYLGDNNIRFDVQFPLDRTVHKLGFNFGTNIHIMELFIDSIGGEYTAQSRIVWVYLETLARAGISVPYSVKAEYEEVDGQAKITGPTVEENVSDTPASIRARDESERFAAVDKADRRKQQGESRLAAACRQQTIDRLKNTSLPYFLPYGDDDK